MKRFVESSSACAALLFLAVSFTAQAHQPAPERQRVRSVPVSYADLDLTREADVKILLTRIEKAAYRACGGNPWLHPAYNVMPARTEAVFKECREDAVARAIGELDAPVLALARVEANHK
jgi:UrcA family protein